LKKGEYYQLNLNEALSVGQKTVDNKKKKEVIVPREKISKSKIIVHKQIALQKTTKQYLSCETQSILKVYEKYHMQKHARVQLFF